jgi:TolB-like protein/AraC-like DNA-binding protein/Tfp pilus assembly protein PilF
MPKQSPKNIVFIKKLTDILDVNLENEQFGVKELTEELGMSRSNLHRKLLMINGKSASRFIREYRLKKASVLLQKNEATVSEIAYQVGFSSPTYFNTCFRQYYGYTPGEAKNRPERSFDKSTSTFTIGGKILNRKLILIFVSVIVCIMISSYFVLPDKKEVLIKNKSIAVLPFRNLSNDTENKYYVYGQMEAILNHLTRISEFRILSATTMMRYEETTKTAPELAKELNVKYVLEGSVQRDDKKLMVYAQLIEAELDKHLWSEDFEGDVTDIFTIQSEIAKSVANSLKITIETEIETALETIPTSDFEAYDFYLKGMNYLNRSMEGSDFNYAIQMFEKAVELDPNFTLAWLGLSASHRNVHWYYVDRGEDNMRKTKRFLDKAVSLNSDLMEVRFENAWFHFQCDLDYPKALDLLNDLRQDYPNNDGLYASIGYVYRRMGEYELFMDDMKKAIAMNPSNWISHWTAGETSIILGRYEDAEEYCLTAIELNPSAEAPHKDLIASYLCMGEVENARNYIENISDIEAMGLYSERSRIELMDGNFDEALKINQSSPSNTFSSHFYFKPKSLVLAQIYRMKSDENMANKYFYESRELLEQKLMESDNDSRVHSALGIAYAGLGMNEKALESSDRAMAIMNVSIDAWKGFHRELDRAKILMMIGKHQEAIKKLEVLLSLNGYLSTELLINDPFWNPLRGLNDFQALTKERIITKID